MKNESESMIYNTEKQVKENESRLSQEIKDNVRNHINALNEALNTNNYESTKQALENLRNSSMEIGRSLYQNASDAQQDTQKNKNPENPESKK